jgi:hypothetical protein
MSEPYNAIAFREAVRTLERRIDLLLALPLDEPKAADLRQHLQGIGQA